MRILVVHRAWVEWIIKICIADMWAPRMRGLFFCGCTVRVADGRRKRGETRNKRQ